jgi:hypothetical protein
MAMMQLLMEINHSEVKLGVGHLTTPFAAKNNYY